MQLYIFPFYIDLLILLLLLFLFLFLFLFIYFCIIVPKQFSSLRTCGNSNKVILILIK